MKNLIQSLTLFFAFSNLNVTNAQNQIYLKINSKTAIFYDSIVNTDSSRYKDAKKTFLVKINSSHNNEDYYCFSNQNYGIYDLFILTVAIWVLITLILLIRILMRR